MTNLFNDITNISQNTEDIVNLQSVENCLDGVTNINYSTEETVYVKDIEHYLDGDIICGKVGKYPWWPCMVTHHLNGETYMKKGNKTLLLVTYFGSIHDYSYLAYNNILNVQSQQEYEKYIQELITKYGKKSINKLKYSKRQEENLTLAWKEAAEAAKMDRDDRVKKFAIKSNLFGKKSKVRNRKNKSNNTNNKPIKSSPKKKIIKPKEPIDYAFTQLEMPYDYVKACGKCCRYCLESKNTVECLNQCGHHFHKDCMEALKSKVETNPDNLDKCVECSINTVACKVCFINVDKSDFEKSLQCSIKSCGNWYHDFCVSKGSMHEMTKWTISNKFICPRHVCHKCELVSPFPKYRCNRLVSCLMCAGTYHTGNWCIPAGSIELSAMEIICPKHLCGGNYSNGISVPPFIGRITSSTQSKIYNDPLNEVSQRIMSKPKRITKPNNVNWCFKCAKGGVLICCETCPAAYHYHCVSLSENSLPDNYYCVDCLAFSYRNYGEIIWAKCGNYRWWPAQILHPDIVPENIRNLQHYPGQFCIQFFGTRDYCWADQGKTFPYEDNDTHSKKRSYSDKVTESYVLGTKEADKGLFDRNLAWRNCTPDQVQGPAKYTKITVNKIINKVKRCSSIPQCDCNPNNALSNCSSSSHCINVELKYECHPNYCKVQNCQNQNFVKRNYPEQELFYSGECGWALKTKKFISKNQFVNEYVGEVIDLKETEIRTEWAHKNNYTDFYFMELENNRVIDARLYSNLSRFMNHSCNPNLYSEKWLVNGELRIGLFALRDIESDEELTFNYNLCTTSPAKIECKCKSANCSGFLGEPPKKATDGKRKMIKSKLSKKFERDESESVSKCSISTSSISLATEKSFESLCFRCFMPADENIDIICTVVNCPKIYHAKCLNLNIKKYNRDSWTCPCHFCDVCLKIANHFCMSCTTSFCGHHITDRNIVSDECNSCSLNNSDLDKMY